MKIIAVLLTVIVTGNLFIQLVVEWVVDPLLDKPTIVKESHNLTAKVQQHTWKITDTSPTSRMSDDEWNHYFAFICWLTILFTGLGSEIIVFDRLKQLQRDWKTDSNLDLLWHVAQFVFPASATISLGCAVHQDFVSVPFLIIGLWKFGFPETTMFLFRAFVAETKGDCWSATISFWSDLLNGAGTCLHHGSASLLICMLTTGVVTPSRPVIDSILPLVVQHWFVLVKYSSHITYVAIELLLEIYFESVVLSNFELFYEQDWIVRHCAATMLFAHWCYLIACGLSLLLTEPNGKEEAALDRLDSISERPTPIGGKLDLGYKERPRQRQRPIRNLLKFGTAESSDLEAGVRVSSV